VNPSGTQIVGTHRYIFADQQARRWHWSDGYGVTNAGSAVKIEGAIVGNGEITLPSLDENIVEATALSATCSNACMPSFWIARFKNTNLVDS